MENSINFRRQILEALLRTRMFPKPELCRSTCQQDDVDIEIGKVYRSVSYSKIEWEPEEPEELEIEKLDV